MNISEDLKAKYVELFGEEMQVEMTRAIEEADIRVPDFDAVTKRVEMRVEGMLSKQIADQIAFTVKERVEEILQKPDFNQKVQDHIIKLLENMQQISFRKV